MLMPDLGVLATGLGQAVAGERSGGTGRTSVMVRKHGNESMRSGVPTTPSPLAEMRPDKRISGHMIAAAMMTSVVTIMPIRTVR